MAQHPETEGPNIKYDLIGHGLQLYADGRIQKITKQQCRYLSSNMEIQIPHKLRKKRLEIHKNEIPRPSKRKSVRIRPGTILLIDVDGRLPNFALMKLSRYHKNQGRKVILVIRIAASKAP